MIAIPNMSKPKDCKECRWHLDFYIEDEQVGGLCTITEKDDKENDCPLIEIGEPKVGRWIDTNMTCYGAKVYKCSVCDNEIDEMPTEMGKPIWKYCPNCGAYMKGE